MRTMLVALTVLAMGTGAALAEGNTGTAFVLWQQEGAMGLPLTPMKEQIRQAHTDEGHSRYVGIAPPRPAAGNPARPTTLGRN